MKPENAGFEAIVALPAMRIGLRTDAQALTDIVYLPPRGELLAPASALTERAARQLERYARDPDFAFDLPIRVAGSEFQCRVWRALCAIGRGKVRTYGEVARDLRSAARAVGQACGANRLPVVIPCHRVVGAAGLGGFAHQREGFLLEVKRWLLRHERAL